MKGTLCNCFERELKSSTARTGSAARHIAWCISTYTLKCTQPQNGLSALLLPRYPPPFCAAWQKVFNKRNSSWFVKQLCKTWTVKPQLTALMWNSWEGGESLAGWDRTQQWCPYSVEGLLSHTTCSPYSFKGKPVTTVWTDGCLASIPWTHGTRRSKGS